MHRKEIKALVKAYRVARDEFDAADDDDCLDCAIDALDRADALARALETLLDE